MANNKKYHWYVIVMTDDGAKFVTKIDYSDKSAYWNKNEEPLEMSKDAAIDLSIGLTLNMHLAYATCTTYEIEKQPYRYNLGSFKWEWNDENETEKQETENK